jgi:hypothetical protein
LKTTRLGAPKAHLPALQLHALKPTHFKPQNTLCH